MYIDIIYNMHSYERNNFSEGSSETKKDVQVIRVRGQQPLYCFHFDFRYVTLVR